MKHLSTTRCCRQKFHGVYVRETCFKRFLEFHNTVASNRTLIYFLKLVSYFSRLLGNHSWAISEGQLTCNSKKAFSSSLGPHFEVSLTRHGEPHKHFFVESIFLSSNVVLCNYRSIQMLHCKSNENQTQWDNNFVLLIKHHVDKDFMHMHNFSRKEQQVM